MRGSSLSAAILLLALAGEARALACAASFQTNKGKATAWKNLGEAAGPKAGPNCVAMAKNYLGNRKPADLGVTKSEICANGTIPVAIYTRLDSNEKRADADAVVATALGVDCPKPKAAKEAPPKT